MKRIAIIGCGAIGTELAHAIDNGIINNSKLHTLYDVLPKKSLFLKKSLINSKPKVENKLKNTLFNCDIIIECANQEAVKQIIYSKAAKGKKLLILSTGALLTYPKLLKIAKINKIHFYLPSGAIAGIDAIEAASMGKIKSVILTTRKSPISLGINKKLFNPKIIFNGYASKAVKFFPSNINVAATLSMSGAGPYNTRVKIIADPSLRENIHKIEVTGNFGKITTQTENVPSKNNPKTSFLAILSAIYELKKMCEE